MENFFNTTGPMSQFISGYEERSAQIEMANFIADNLDIKLNGLVEAGTGTGKTMAYLIPALKYALQHEKKIYVSTETKALQKQLIDKDIPVIEKLLSAVIDKEFKYSICLGSSNYPCRRRFELLVQRGVKEKGDIPVLEDVKERFEKKTVFTKLDFGIRQGLWVDIRREGDACLSYRCPFSSGCSYMMARKEWEKADLLIMNHHLYFTNIASGRSYLPEGDIVIIDEAHSIEDIASEQLGLSLTEAQLVDILQQFNKPGRKKNLINSIKRPELKIQVATVLEKITVEANDYYESLQEVVGKDKMVERLREPTGTGSKLVEAMKIFSSLLLDIEEFFEDDEVDKMDFDIAKSRYNGIFESLKIFIYQNFENYVYWLEKSGDDIFGNITLMAQPIDISDIMEKEVTSQYDSVFFVSATLSVDKDFSFITKRLGVTNHKTISLESPFDYKNQVVLYVGQYIKDPLHEDYIEQVGIATREIVNHLNGNCLVLFTSYKMMGEIREGLEYDINFPIHSQDESSASEAMARYLDDEDSVLLGTHSFWQGIDLPGDLLRGVVITKLPFRVPDSPPVQARIESIKASGANPFFSYQLPEAVIRFKQGFGRLIRSSQDKGIIAILDSRIATKSYGSKFFNSLPNCRVVYSIGDLKKEYDSLIEE